MTRKFAFKHHNIEYYRFSVYRMKMNVQTVYTYIVDDILLDTAQRHNRANIYDIVKDKNIQKIVLTHHHEDHSGNVNFLMKKLKVEAFAHENCVDILSKGYKISPLGKLINGTVEKANLKTIYDGEIIETQNYKLETIYTPGHCNDHFCFYEKNNGYMFSGDLYVADKIKYFAHYESVAEQIQSIKKLLTYNFDTLFCSHNPKATGGKIRLQNKLQFLQDFEGSVQKLANEGFTSSQIFKQLGLKENNYYKVITVGNFCAENMVKSVLKDSKNLEISTQ